MPCLYPHSFQGERKKDGWGISAPEKICASVGGVVDIIRFGDDLGMDTIHNIIPDVPPENIVAMYEAVAEFNGCSSQPASLKAPFYPLYIYDR